MKSWHPPLLLIVILFPSAAAFALVRPEVGVAVAGVTTTLIVVWLMVKHPWDPIGRTPHPELDRRLLVVTTFPIEDAAAITRVADEVKLGYEENESEIRLLTPADNTFLHRWATDLEAARDRARSSLVVSVASLTLAGVAAQPLLGDEDVVLAVEDELAAFDATEVFLVTRRDPDSKVAEELRARLLPRFHHVNLD
ncbi:MAG: hypothetical protein M9938_09400 [Solirubrobacterales bacterium]|nr:hypothetical protein [Solirubrobacterales bacterium]